MATSILELGASFDVRDLAKKAREAASMFDGGEVVGDEEAMTLLVLNAGLDNFLTGEYKAEEPESGKVGTEAVSEWVEFAHDIAHTYEHLSDEGYTIFHKEDTIADVLAEQGEENAELDKLPAYITQAIDWDRVRQSLSGNFVEMFIDGETYVSNVYLNL